MWLIPALRLGLDTRAPDVVTVVGGGGKTSLLFRLADEITGQGKRVVTATTTRVAGYQLQRAPAHIRIHDNQLPYDELARRLDEHGHCLLVGTETLLNGKQAGVAPHLIDELAAQPEKLAIAAIVVEADGSRTLPVKAPADHEPVVPQSTTLLAACLGLDAIGAPLDDAHAHRAERIRALLGVDDPAQRLTAAHAARLLTHPQGGAKALPPSADFLPILNKADTAPRLAAGRQIAALLAREGVPALITALGAPQGEPVLERWGPVAVVVLAAGEGSRFAAGGPKQAALVQGEPLVRIAVRNALESGAKHVLLVTGAHEPETRTALGNLVDVTPRLRLVHNPGWSQGQAGSLRSGIQALPATVQAAILMPVDQPWLEPVLLRRLIALWQGGADLAAPFVDGEVRGAPALFDRRHFGELAALSGDRGGRGILLRERAHVAVLPTDAATLADVDEPADLARAQVTFE